MEITQVGSIAIDFDKEQIINSVGDVIELRPQTFSVFSYLYKNRGRVVTKEELFDEVWGGRRVSVTDDSLVKCISEIRKSLGESSSIDLKTVTRRGYLLTESMVLSEALKPSNSEIPTIAILDFSGLTEDAAIFAAGLTEELTTLLSSQKELFVLARHSTNAYKIDKGIDSINAICDVLNVRYLLQGTVQKIMDSTRVNIQLSEAERSTHLWSEKYDETDPNIFDVQDRISSKIINRIGGSAGILITAQRNELHRNKPSSPKAYELYVMASNIDKSLSENGLAESIDLCKKAVTLDPLFSRAWGRLAALHLFSAVCAYAEDIESAIEQYIESAMRALELDSNDSMSQALAGGAYCYLNEFTKARECFDRALSLGPNNADTLALVSYIRPTKFKTVSIDLENIRKAKSLNPYYPMWYSLSHGYCAYHGGEYEESINSLKNADSNIPDTQLYLLLSYSELGDKMKIAHHKKALTALNPEITVSQLVKGDAMIDKSSVDHFYKSAKKAGIPE